VISGDRRSVGSIRFEQQEKRATEASENDHCQKNILGDLKDTFSVQTGTDSTGGISCHVHSSTAFLTIETSRKDLVNNDLVKCSQLHNDLVKTDLVNTSFEKEEKVDCLFAGDALPQNNNNTADRGRSCQPKVTRKE
jgi:hypothetical protein